MSRFRIPLFPLNTVLFPRMPLPLHVFEKRFVALIERCVAEKSEFGVVLARDPDERGREIADVGTVAHLQAVQKLEEGRYNILVVGGERFSVLTRGATPDGYDIALVETVTDLPADPAHLEGLVMEVRRLFAAYFAALVERAGLKSLQYDLPDDPSDLSFIVASVIQLPGERRQQLLESTSTPERLQQEIAWLEQGIKRLEEGGVHGQVAHLLDAAKAREEVSRN
jgi:Lon protease-like protein